MKKKLYYVLSTHWDREWYQSFQDYRYRLVELLDEVADGISSGELKGPFYTDGQFCLLEDYLEVKPHKSEQVKNFLRSGKIVAGPWYVLPDEFLISGESLIRNIRFGMNSVRDLGAEPSKAGFLNDMFGHISQVPQLFRLFDLKAGFIWRGLNCDKRGVIWVGADGSELPAYVFGGVGYGDYSHDVRDAYNDHYKKIDPRGFPEKLKNYINKEIENSEIDSILIFDGLDHQFWDKTAYNCLFDYVNTNDIDVVHVSLDDFVEEFLKETGKITVKKQGELREVAEKIEQNECWLIPGVLSSRIDVKQENSYCERLLCKWAEPFSVFSDLLVGHPYKEDFMKVAWKWLIKNHPHDSICGCSIDQVHRDMVFRFSQAKQIGERITEEALRKIAINVNSELESDSLRVVVFNACPKYKDEVIELELCIPEHWKVFKEYFGFEDIPGFRIFDCDGNEIEYQRLSKSLGEKRLSTFKTKIPVSEPVIKVRVGLKLTIPPIGYKTLTVKNTKEGEPVRFSSQANIAHSGNCLENEFLKVTVNRDGTLSIFDKRNEQLYDNLLWFEDNADIGDGWFHGVSVNDIVFNSFGNSSEIAIISNGPELAAVRVTNNLHLPEEFSFSKMTRSQNCNKLNIENYLTLKKGSDRLEVQTMIKNNVKDHRLRVCFRSDVRADSYFTDSLFDVIERDVNLDREIYKYKELDVGTRPQQNWTAISDNTRGLAILSPGIYESTVSDDQARDIKLTLFRSTRRTIFTSGEPDGQLLKPLVFKYAVMPICGQIDNNELFEKADSLSNSVRNVQIRNCDLQIENTVCNKLPAEDGFINVEDAVLTSISKYEDHIELRFFNPADSAISAKLSFISKTAANKFSKVAKMDLDNKRISKKLDILDSSILIPMKPKEIINLILY